MCGLVASYFRDGRMNYKLAENSLMQLNHRGPDFHSSMFLDNVFLGHSRLSIIDIKNGKQPFCSAADDIYAIINGELYGHAAIRAKLQKLGYLFNSQCDGEIIIGLYLEYGTELFKHLRGEFSFIIWDRRKKRIFAARDRMGIKPLYYTIYNNNLFMASEIKAIFEFEVPVVWNSNYIAAANHGIYSAEETCFNNIYAIPPGGYLIASADDIKIERYWSLDSINSVHYDSGESDHEYINKFRELFKDSVRERLIADVPVGCYLSGGIDSTATLAMANTLSSVPLKAFTIKFNDQLFDESIIACKSAEFLGSSLLEINVTDKDIADNISDSIWHGESIICNTHGVALYLLSKHVQAQGYKVVLTGHGADEMLCGYSFFKEDIIHNKLSRGINSSELDNIRKNPIGAGIVTTSFSQQGRKNNLIDYSFIENYVPTLFQMYIGRGHDFLSLYNINYLNKTLAYNVVKKFVESIDGDILRKMNKLDISTCLFIKSTLQGYILSTIGDRQEMAHSIEGRVPFLDQNMLDFLAGLPTDLKIRGLNEKYILREALKDILPEHIYTRQKHPFAAPPANIHLLKLMEEVFNSDLLKYSPFYSQKKVIKQLNSILGMEIKERIALDSRLLEILSSCLLSQRFNINNTDF